MRPFSTLIASLVLCAAVSAQVAPFAFHFEFDLPTPMPTATANVNLGNLTAYPSATLFSPTCGVMQQRTGTNNSFGAFFYGGTFSGYPATAVTLSSALPVVLEANLRVVGLASFGTTNILGAVHGGNVALGVDCIAGTIGLQTNSGYVPAAVPGGIFIQHTYRIEAVPNGPLTVVTLFVDGAPLVGPAIAPASGAGANGWYFGDSAGGPQGADVDWQYVTVANGNYANVGQANSAAASLFVNRTANTVPGAPGIRGPFPVTTPAGSTMTLEWNGPANQPFVLIVGPQNPGAFNFGCTGIIDIGTPFAFSDINIVFDPFAPFIGAFFWLDNCGYAKQTMVVPPYLPGTPLANMQGLVFQPSTSTCGVVFTAAFYVSA